MDYKESAEQKKNCKKCNRKGLPILLTRYAIAPENAYAPKIHGDFKVMTKDGVEAPKLDAETTYTLGEGDTKKIINFKGTTYTQRLLRAGYVYVYDPEKKNALGKKSPWQGYVVNKLGYLTPFPIPRAKNYEMPSPLDSQPPCDAWANEMLARCISIENPDTPRTIWIGFSDTAWTKAVRIAHEDEAYRKLHMRKFEVGTWWGSGKHEHACSFDDYKPNVAGPTCAEKFVFSQTPLDGPLAVINSQALADHFGEKLTFPISKEKEKELWNKYSDATIKANGTAPMHISSVLNDPTDQLLRVAERLLGKEKKNRGAIVALDDPVGILMDLAVYIEHQFRLYRDETLRPKFEREFTIAKIIEAMQHDGMRERILVEHKQFADMTDEELRIWQQKWRLTNPSIKAAGTTTTATGTPISSMTPPPDVREDARKKLKHFEENPKLLEEAAEKEWKKYAKKIDPKKMAQTNKDFEEALKKFDKDHTLCLAQAFVDWFKSEKFTSSMACNHDENDIESGHAYMQIVLCCLGSLQDKTPVLEKIIIPQLESRDVDDVRQVLSRALIANQKIEAANLKMALDSNIGDFDTLEGQMEIWSKVLYWAEKSMSVYYAKKASPTNPTGPMDSELPELLQTRIALNSQMSVCTDAATAQIARNAKANGPLPITIIKKGFMNGATILRIEIADSAVPYANFLSNDFVETAKGMGIKLTKKQMLDPLVKKIDKRLEVEKKNAGNSRAAGGGKLKTTMFIIVDNDKFSNKLGIAKDKATATGKPVTVGVSTATDSIQLMTASSRRNSATGMTFQQLEEFTKDGSVVEFKRNSGIVIKSGGVVETRGVPAASASGAAGSPPGGTPPPSEGGRGRGLQEKLPPAVSILSSCLQFVAFGLAYEELFKAAGGNKEEFEKELKLFTAVSFCTIHAITDMLEGFAKLWPRLVDACPAAFDNQKFLLKYVGKGFGIAGGLVMTAIYYGEATEAKENEQYGMAALYYLSAATSLAGAGLLFYVTFINPAFITTMAFSVWGWVLLAIGVVLLVLISIFIDDALEDWLGRCVFGVHTTKKFRWLGEELKALEAMKAPA